MFPETMNTADIKKVSELWEGEKKYRWWIIGFAVSLVVLFALNLSLVIIAYRLEIELVDYFKTFFTTDIDKRANQEFTSVVGSLIGMTVAFFLCCCVFIYSIFNCYKVKSFEKLDSFSSFFLGFQTFFSLLRLFDLVRISDIYFGNTFMICYFILPLLTIPVWLLLSREVKKIKRSFFIAKRQEEINAYYEANKGQMGMEGNNPFQQQSPFGFPFQQRKQNPIPQPQNGESVSEIKQQDGKFSKLQLMTMSQLRRIADKLSISGNKEMKKPELIKTILLISQSLEANDKKENDEINIDLDDEKIVENKPKSNKETKSKKEQENN